MPTATGARGATMTIEPIDRIDRCVIAIHDIGSREGMKPVQMTRLLKAAGFTAEEIAKAVNRMHPIGGSNG